MSVAQLDLPRPLECATQPLDGSFGQPLDRPVAPPIRHGKVVLISYVFPPDNTSGAIRVGKFVQHLSTQHGWSLDVITPRRKSMSSQFAANQMAFTDSVCVRRTRNFEIFDAVARWRRKPAVSQQLVSQESGPPRPREATEETASGRPGKDRKRSLAARFSDLLAVPDTRTGWIFWAACGALRSIGSTADRTVLFSSGPPHSAHVAAAIVKAITGRPWVVDLRDPWSSNPYSAVTDGPADRWNQRLERLVLRHADAILCNTIAARQLFRQRFPDLADSRLVTVPNGFDPEDFEDVAPCPCWPSDTRPVLLHAGSIYGARTPFALLSALGALYAEAPSHCPRLAFLGEWDPHVRSEADRIISSLRLSDLITMRDCLPRRDAIAAQAAADGLILLGDSSTSGVQIPGKLFEYLRLQKPLLSLFAAGSPVEAYLHRYAPVHACAAPNDVHGIVNALRHLSDANNESPQPCHCIDELSRGYQVRMVHNVLQDVLN